MRKETRPQPTSWWRLWALQSGWNPRAMQGLGMAVAALPWLRRRGLDPERERAWLAEQLRYRNTNPYLAGLVLGAALRAREELPETRVTQVEAGLDRALGSIGDALFWGGLWPAVGAAAAAGALLLGPAAAVTAWLGFAVGQGWLRNRCLRLGYEQGFDVIRLLEDPRVHVWVRRAQAVGMGALCFLTGTLLVAWLQSSRSIGGGALAVGATAAVVLGGIVAWRRWSPDTVALLGLAMAWLLAAATGVLT